MDKLEPLCTVYNGSATAESALAGPQKANGLPWVAQVVKNLPSMQETWVQSLGGEDALETERLLLPRESQGQRSLAGYSRGVVESDRTERLAVRSLHKHRTTTPQLRPLNASSRRTPETPEHREPSECLHTRGHSSAGHQGASCPHVHPGLKRRTERRAHIQQTITDLKREGARSCATAWVTSKTFC